MPPIHAIDRLNDLLCLMEFRKTARHLASGNDLRTVVAWAEEAVIAGDRSEPLLILASLGLDSTPEEDEVRHYLERYMAETGLVYPGPNLSVLVWLRTELTQLLQHKTIDQVEAHLAFFSINPMEYGPPFFTKICRHLNWLYYYIFDDAGGGYPSVISGMTEGEVLDAIHKEFHAFELVLYREQWLSWLANEPLPNR